MKLTRLKSSRQLGDVSPISWYNKTAFGTSGGVRSRIRWVRLLCVKMCIAFHRPCVSEKQATLLSKRNTTKSVQFSWCFPGSFSFRQMAFLFRAIPLYALPQKIRNFQKVVFLLKKIVHPHKKKMKQCVFTNPHIYRNTSRWLVNTMQLHDLVKTSHPGFFPARVYHSDGQNFPPSCT